MPKHPAKQFVMVVWDDAHGNASTEIGEEDVERKHRGARYQSYGWLLRSDGIGVTIAGEFYPEDRLYRATMFIPRGMVIEELPLALVKPRRKKERGNESKPQPAP